MNAGNMLKTESSNFLMMTLWTTSPTFVEQTEFMLLVGLTAETWWGKTDVLDPMHFGSIHLEISSLVAGNMKKIFS
jgi:hypothetical protein